MHTLLYTVIKTEDQYKAYCAKLEELVFLTRTEAINQELELLTVLIEKWTAEHNTFKELDPIELLKSFMKDHHLKAKDVADLLQIGKGYMSDILHYKKGLSKEVILKLSLRFKVTQDAFNRPYKLKVPENSHLRNSSVMNTKKQLETA